MFPALIIARMMVPVRVKTEASFSADDPWNQNQHTEFTVEAYLKLMKGAKPKAGSKPLGALYLYGIRSNVDGMERMLPDSLSEMWGSKRIPIEALPRLLKEMLPTLKKADYNPVLRNKSLKFGAWFFAVLFALIGLGILAIALFTDVLPWSFAVPCALAFGAFAWLYVWLLYSRFNGRRVRQMQWISERV